MTPEFPKNLDDARNKFIRQKPDLVINRVPGDTLVNFKKLAEDEFNGDYGFTLKFLLDGYGDGKLDYVFGVLQSHEERLCKLEGTPEVRKIRMMSGRIIEVKGKEK